MLKSINTIPIQLFIQQVKSADSTQQKDVRLNIKDARALAFCLTEVSTRLFEDYNTLLTELLNAQGTSENNVQMDGGAL